MIALFSLLTVILLSIIVVRVGAIALELTGLSSEIASFQSQSAFSGAGFTTSESETIVTHPLRRRIIRVLILLGSAGVTTSIATLVLAFVGERGGGHGLLKGVILVTGLLVIFLFARSRHLYRIMRNIISKSLRRWTTLRVFDYEQLLGFNEGYSISRIVVKKDSLLHERKLSELRLDQKGILVLAIYRKLHGKEKFIGGTTGETVLKSHDALICYSRQDASKALAQE